MAALQTTMKIPKARPLPSMQTSTHEQRAAFNAKNGAGAWAAQKNPITTMPVGNPTPRPMAPGMGNPDPRPMAPGTPAFTPTAPATLPAPIGTVIPPPNLPTAPGPVTAMSMSPMIPIAASGPASAHAQRAAYNQLNGAGSAANATRHQLRAAYNQINGPGAAKSGAVAAPAAPLAPGAPAAPAPALPPTGGPDPVPEGLSNEMMQTLFPSTRMFEPQNYGGSPLYQFQLQEGQKGLDRALAKQGMTKSGNAITENVNLPLRVAAQDTDRMTRIASENADRAKSFMDNEALRQERAGNSQWDRQLSLAQLMAQQSPWAGALAGLNNTADITNESGQAQANFLRDYYKKLIGGGGGGGVPMQVPTGGPDYTNLMPAQSNAQFSSNNGWMNLLTQGLANLI